MDKLRALRKYMEQLNIDWYIVPTADYHNSEYVDSHFKCREWLSGFTGSNGTMLIGKNEAFLWTDGRYFVQAEEQLDGTEIKLMKMGENGVPTISKFLNNNAKNGEILGFDGRVCPASYIERIAEENPNLSICSNIDAFEHIWEDRPAKTCNKVYVLPMEYCGESYIDKIQRVRDRMAENKARVYFLSKLDDIMWLFNIRGCDIEYNPVAMSFAFITMKDVYLFIEREAVSPELTLYARINNIVLMDYDQVYSFLDDFDYKNESYRDALQSFDKEDEYEIKKNGYVILDKNEVNYQSYCIINERANIINKINITSVLKMVKNETEIEAMRRFFLADSVAVVKFLHWIDTVDVEGLTELDVASKLDGMRADIEGFKGLSFPTISAYADNAAIVHYEPNPDTAKKLEPRGMILIDSGGQYLGATTDITRTIVLGELTNEEKHDYTLVLKGWLGLLNVVFAQGCGGRNLDILARSAMWKEGRDYKHGTGHGVGCFLNVHEGPVNIRYKNGGSNDEVCLMPGMIVTNEPGLYEEGKHGIRIENTMIVTQSQYEGFFMLDSLTLVPVDLRAIDFEIISNEEKELLSKYQKRVYDSIVSYLDEQEKEWYKTMYLID